MSESAMSLRPVSGAEEFDRRMRSLAPSTAPHSDALAELARLVGHQDPFRDLPAAEPAAPAGPPAAEADLAVFDAGAPPAYPLSRDAALVRSPVDDSGWERAPLRYPTISVRDQAEREPSPDVWAQGAIDRIDEADATAPPSAAAGTAPSEGGGARRTLIVLAAVVALTGGGLAASFLAKPSGAAVAVASTAPTILAATGPAKVQPETPPVGADAPSQPSTLLDKNNNDGTTAAHVVNSIEQPVDLNQAIKPAAAEPVAEPAPAAPASAFPEPRRVKTVLVRPDGSIIANAPPQADDAAAAPATDQASLAFNPRTSLPIAAVPAAAAAVPSPAAADPVVDAPRKPAAKPAAHATPKPAASTTQDASADAQGRTTVATPKAKPVVHAPAKPAVVATATTEATTPDAATPATPAAGSGGAFAIQLGAAPSEAEGHDAAKRLAQKYDLGAAQPSVIKAQAGGKTVYRIRLGHLSQDEAKALCAKVQAGGGGCFVARN